MNDQTALQHGVRHIHRHFHRIAWFAVALALGVIVFGAFVRLSHAPTLKSSR